MRVIEQRDGKIKVVEGPTLLVGDTVTITKSYNPERVGQAVKVEFQPYQTNEFTQLFSTPDSQEQGHPRYRLNQDF